MGEADNYYNPNQQPPYGYSNGGGYQQQYQPQPPPATHQQQYQQPPPQQPYQQAAPQNGNGYMPAQGYGGNEKASFEEHKVIGHVFITFTMYWFSEWLKNTWFHTTIAGVYIMYQPPNDSPSCATRGFSEGKSLDLIGSIALSLYWFIQFYVNALFCCIGCLLGILEWAFINSFCHIALGSLFAAAIQDTWKMITAALINVSTDRFIFKHASNLCIDCLIGPVLSFGGLFIAYACGLLALYLYLYFAAATDPPYNSKDGQYTAVVMIANIFTTGPVLSSGVLFVAAGWDPQVYLWRDHPEPQEMCECQGSAVVMA
ncbi:hypothetical protein CEK25_006564 [Fusarium fujikuroi]|nr:hypothetical protein CEK25_006564 [Fusarium fujikuroi]